MKLLKNWFKDFKRGVKNLYYYFPVIWKDRDWDHEYMETLMLVKLKKWYKVYSDVDNLTLPYEGIEKDLQAMRICITVLERRKESWYTNVWHSKYAYRQKMEFTPIEGSTGYKMDFTGLTPEEREKSSEWADKVHKCEDRDWKLFCKIFEIYFTKWWD